MPRSATRRSDSAPTTRPDAIAHTPNTSSPSSGEWFGENVMTAAGTSARSPRTTGTTQYWVRSGAASRAVATATSFTSEGGTDPSYVGRTPRPDRSRPGHPRRLTLGEYMPNGVDATRVASTPFRLAPRGAPASRVAFVLADDRDAHAGRVTVGDRVAEVPDLDVDRALAVERTDLEHRGTCRTSTARCRRPSPSIDGLHGAGRLRPGGGHDDRDRRRLLLLLDRRGRGRGDRGHGLRDRDRHRDRRAGRRTREGQLGRADRCAGGNWTERSPCRSCRTSAVPIVLSTGKRAEHGAAERHVERRRP